MPTMIFVNLAVDDLPAARRFYEALGWAVDPRFSDENAVSVVVSDTIRAMLLTRPFFAQFTGKEIVDARTSTEVQLALSADSKEAVDALHEKALAAGGTSAGAQDFGFMYSKSFDDLDGHRWDAVWMDPQAAEDGPPELSDDDFRAGIVRP